MQTVINICEIVVSCVMLGWGAGLLVDSAVRLARRFGISELVIGLTIVAMGTSAPEFAVTIAGAITGSAEISVGNIVGSNIFNIGFILGGCAVVAVLETRGRALVWRDGGMLLGATVLLLWMLWDHNLGRIEGVVFLALLAGYMGWLLYQRETVLEDVAGKGVAEKPLKDLMLFIVGVAMVVTGGWLLVRGAVGIARAMGLKEWVIAVTVVAAGTSVPELVVSLVALVKKRHGISAGNLIGSNIFNTLGVLGIAAVIRPLGVDASAVFSVEALVVLTVLVLLFMRSGWRLVRAEGIILLLVSCAIWTLIIWQFSTPAAEVVSH